MGECSSGLVERQTRTPPLALSQEHPVQPVELFSQQSARQGRDEVETTEALSLLPLDLRSN